ncbi:hypothetical protein QJS10_CPB19g01318 [Acorus calamus]|uniref:Serine/threonine-protein phosphatase n=1 Tax=Acorus calamus TaxID=4465 RepID=A0AAV9CEX1_ACOCL|nr:hypothetical protein QJS10_CPB19g01318 [Acorus calamus]
MEVDSSMATETVDHSSGSASDRHLPDQQEQQPNSDSGPPTPTVSAAAVVVGPRPAPTYTVMKAIIEKKEDGPGSRCGHTLTAVAAVGEEGSPNYIGPRLILFGGATALEGNSAAPPSSAGGAGIRLAGATADVHCYDVLSTKWSRLTPLGEPPSPRAAHVATAVGTMVVIQGGIGPAGLSAEDLHVLDLTQPRPRWHRVVVQGPGPGPRYGHVMALVGQRFLLAIGGNDDVLYSYEDDKLGNILVGKRPLADVWALDTAAKPYEWRKLEPEGEGPPPCMYATASARSDGLLLLCGGRDANSVPLASAYGLAKHRDGRWEWAIAPGVSPSPRYQHAAVFVNARLHVSGGALGGGRMVEDSSSIAVLDTAAGVWCDTNSVVTSPRAGRYSADAAGGDASVELTRRCRHAAAAVGDLIFIYGGLRGVIEKIGVLWAGRLPGRYAFGDERTRQVTPEAVPDGAVVLGSPVAPPVNGDMYADISTENAMLQGQRRLSKGVEYLVEASAAEAEAISATLAAAKARQINGEAELPDRDRGAEATPSGKPISTLVKVPEPVLSNNNSPLGVRLHHRAVIAHLLKPRGWKPPVRRQFFLDCNEIADLCDSAEHIFSSEPSVLQIKAPVKIFGDLHGQFGDLMRLFDEYGSPSTAGDISYIDYLFLGDYVDRGQHSLETITLLLALKVEYPHNVHLIRGNHEAADINALFGFRIECIERMIENLQRPITMEAGSVVLMDLLWSDPTENDSVEGLRPNARGPGLVTFGVSLFKLILYIIK